MTPLKTLLALSGRTTLPAVLIGWFSFAALLSCHQKEIIPAQQIAGTWSTEWPVNFYQESDTCGTYEKVLLKQISMTWTITYMATDTVHVVVSPALGTLINLAPHCSVNDTLVYWTSATGGYFPLNLHGVVTSSNLILQEIQPYYDSVGAAKQLIFVDVGNFDLDLTSNRMRGLFIEKYCTSHCRGYQTDTLVMQK